VVHRPRFGLGTPLWVDAPTFDISDHVGMFAIDGPATEEQVLQACEVLRSRQRDPSKPPWEMWFLTGMGEGRVGLFVKLCHAVADGIAGVGALAALLDLSPEESAPFPRTVGAGRSPIVLGAPQRQPAPAPGEVESKAKAPGSSDYCWSKG
jgi:hypothetical protein